MKLIKTIIAATLMASSLIGLQAFAHGGGGGGGHAGGGGFAGGAHASFGAASRGGGWGGGGFGRGSMAWGNGHRSEQAGRCGAFGGFGRGLFGYGFGGYGYGGGYGCYPFNSYYGNAEPQPVDNSAVDYERERDRKRLQLPDKAFVKNYGRAAPAQRRREGVG